MVVKSKINFLKSKKLKHWSYKPKSSTVFTKLDNTGIIFNLKNRRFYSLNDTAGKIWKAIAKSVCVEDIVKQMISEYDINRDSAEESIVRQIGDFLTNDLIEPIK